MPSPIENLTPAGQPSGLSVLAGSVGSRFADPEAVLCEAEAWADDVDGIDDNDRMHEEHMALALWDELRAVRRKWKSDQAIFCGALQLLKEAGLAPGSAELIEAAARFDSQNVGGDTPRAKPEGCV